MDRDIKSLFNWDEVTGIGTFYSRIDFRVMHEQHFDSFASAFNMHCLLRAFHDEGVKVGQRQAVKAMEPVITELERLSV